MFSLAKSLVLISVLVVSEVQSVKVTVEQMQQVFQPIKLVCFPRSKITDEQFKSVQDGNFVDKKEVKCFLGCVLEMANMMKKGKLLYDSVMKSIDTLMPEEMRDGTRNAINKCKGDVAGLKDSCEAGFALLKCFHPLNPQFIKLFN